MALNKRKKSNVTAEQADAVANQLADKPYGKQKEVVARTTIALPRSLLSKLEKVAFENKQNRIEPKSVSAIIRKALYNNGFSD